MNNTRNLIVFLFVLLVTGCRSNSRMTIGEITLKSDGHSEITAAIPRNGEQPWRLEFTPEGGFNGESEFNEQVSITVRNNDSEPLEIDTGRTEGKITIYPSKSEKIFTGSINQMIMIGRTSRQEMTLNSSKYRNINVTLIFNHELKRKDLKIKIDNWILHYGA